jgi:hypothetical protein
MKGQPRLVRSSWGVPVIFRHSVSRPAVIPTYCHFSSLAIDSLSVQSARVRIGLSRMLPNSEL